MATLVMNCPHCRAALSTFTINGEFQDRLQPISWSFLAACSSCNAPICGVLMYASNSGQPKNPSAYPGNLLASQPHWRVLAVWPQSPAPDLPSDIPAQVLRAYRQGIENLLPASVTNPDQRRDSAACAMFGQAMELAMKDLSPDVEAWKLERRIDKLAELGRITPALQEWAHEIRLDRNATLHEGNDPDPQTAQEVKEFTKYLLLYLYTLPAQVEAARTRRSGGHAS